ncbi:MAG TPA: GerMN domain-containing protein [Vicinamibacterales bacterium]|nr:GerMN domain-containing protein [Vicinamibacterales bacterium]
MLRRAAPVIAVAAVAIVGAWLLFYWLPRRSNNAAPAPASAAAPAPSIPGRKITATLYYVAEDGMSLVGVQREVPFGEPVAEQARWIVETQLGPAPHPFAASVPSGTTLRGVYVTERECGAAAATEACQRDAFVDLSAEARTAHTGGALDELFTIYAIVDAITVNLPVISRVQILVEGKEVDTLAGHVDLRHPLEKNLKWVRTEKGE